MWPARLTYVHVAREVHGKGFSLGHVVVIRSMSEARKTLHLVYLVMSSLAHAQSAILTQNGRVGHVA